MSNRVFLVRVSYLVPVLAADELAAEEYVSSAESSVLEDALACSQEAGEEVFTVERELTTLDMEGSDSETWGDVIPFCADTEEFSDSCYPSIEEILDEERRPLVELELTTLASTEA